jgi:hypothetical protein
MRDVQPERRSTTLVVALIVTLSLAVVCGLVAMWWAAYDRQAARVTKIRHEYEKLAHDHMIIGENFAQQKSQLDAAMKSMSGAYQRGFVSGRKSATLPAPFKPLWPAVRAGYVVPLSVPRQLHDRPVVKRQTHGYTVRWKTVALYASDRETLEDWKSKAWPRTARNVRAGLRMLTRIVGPYGTVYAWRERNKTYAVVAKPTSDGLAVPLVKTLG